MVNNAATVYKLFVIVFAQIHDSVVLQIETYKIPEDLTFASIKHAINV